MKEFCKQGHPRTPENLSPRGACLTCNREWQSNWRKTEGYLAAIRKYRYGVSEEDYSRMFQEQDGLCAICKRPERRVRNGKIQSLSIDHNHETGKVRQLLCDDCNTALGRVEENLDILKAMIEYLGRHS